MTALFLYSAATIACGLLTMPLTLGPAMGGNPRGTMARTWKEPAAWGALGAFFGSALITLTLLAMAMKQAAILAS